jgi:hypothetical protein
VLSILAFALDALLLYGKCGIKLFAIRLFNRKSVINYLPKSTRSVALNVVEESKESAKIRGLKNPVILSKKICVYSCELVLSAPVLSAPVLSGIEGVEWIRG